jgi:hypothetical protein
MIWQLIVWWSGLFGITDPQAVQIVAAVIAAGIFLFALYFVAALGLAIAGGGFRRH